MRVRFITGLLAIGMVAFAASAWSHHAHGNYSLKTHDIEGVVTEMHLLNPHSWLYIEVTGADGQKKLWALEGSSRGQLERMGVTNEYIKTGDRVKVRCHPLTDGSPGCLLGLVKARDGSVKDWDGEGSTVPKDF